MTRSFVGLGANLEDPRAQIERALELLAAEDGVELVAVSTLRETDPVGYEDQPRFLNGAAELRTSLGARELLERLLAIERRLGRVRGEGPRFGPRTIDLDLLLYGDEQIDEPGLADSASAPARAALRAGAAGRARPRLELPGRGPVQALLAGL